MGFFFNSSSGPLTDSRTDFRLAKTHGCTICPLNKERLRNPRMLPTGTDEPIIYNLGEAPGEEEDKSGIQFIGASGEVVRNVIKRVFDTKTMDSIMRWNNVVRCRPPKNRPPNDMEIECCRQSIREDIEKTKPAIIIGYGNVPLNWIIKQDGIQMWRGRRVPVKIGSHTCWYFPMLHPAFILRNRRESGESEYEKIFKWDMEQIRMFLEDESSPEPLVVEKGYGDGVHIFEGPGHKEEIVNWLDKFDEGSPIGIDIETTALRPYSGGQIATVAISDFANTIAFPINHPDLTYGYHAPLGNFLFRNHTKVCHNLTFEKEWLSYFYGDRCIIEGKWADTMAQSYLIDERANKSAPMHSLDLCCLVNFGFNLKALTTVDRKNVRKAKLKDLLYYNALDAKYTTLLYLAQHAELTEQLKLGHAFLCKTATTIALMQKKGWELNKSRIKEFTDELDRKLEGIKKELDSSKEIKEFERMYRTKYNYNSNDHIASLLYDVLKLKPIKSTTGGKEKAGKPSTDHEVLKYYGEIGVRPAQLTLEHRELLKLKSTYIEPALGWVYDDGLVHTSYRHTATRTGRLSSADPNMQNLPKKKGVWVRELIKAREGNYLLAVDYGQIEARCIAMASQDPVFCNNLRKGYDTHKEWAIKVINSFILHEGNWNGYESVKAVPDDILKDFRSKMKNGVVFPWFYGASKYSVAEAMGMSETIMEEVFKDFWDTFRGVKRWQERLITFYEKHKYVETLTGRRRHGPMTKNELINCVDEETLILSEYGWKKYNEVEEGDLILTQNPETLNLEWKPIQIVNIFPDYKGPVYNFKAKSFSACVTPNHRWLIRCRNGRKREWIYKFVETEKLSTWGDHGIPKIGQYESYPTSSTWKDEEVELIGWILTDGYFVKNYIGKKGLITKKTGIGITQSKPHRVLEIKKLIKKLGINPSEFLSKKGSKHNHGNYDGYNWLFTKVTAGDLPLKIREALPNKVLTIEFLLSLPKHQLEILLNSMMRGDGMFEGEKYKAFCSGTKQGAEMFAILAFICGYPVTINYRKLKVVTKQYKGIGNIPQGKEIWKVGFHNRTHFQTGWGKTEIKEEEKLMWCPTVENSTFVAMREGTIYITGNSPIQGTASDIVVDAGNRLSQLAYDLKKPHLQIMLNVHDELVFDVPDGVLDETIPFVAEQMCMVPFKFIGDIPIEVEVSIGPNWGIMEDICKYDSTMFPHRDR